MMKPEINHEPISTKVLLPFLQEMLDLGKQVQLTVTGNSMLPLLRNGIDSVLLTKSISLKKYDVVLYVRKNGDVILHRIVSCKSDGFMILGDNQSQVDGPIAASQIIATMVGFYRNETYYSVQKWWYKLYSRLWTLAGPFRRFLLPFTRKIGRIIKRLEKTEMKL